MTEKLYYKDAYIKKFTATVLDCTENDGKYLVTLDRTAFFPEEGGQYADRGTIDGVAVLDVQERDGGIYHYTEKPIAVGKEVYCELDFARRFENMQLHTAEHILCGIIHRLYGYDNVGFHLGEDVVTFDISAPLSREQLDFVEDEANRAVFANIAVETLFPTPDELPSMTYRAKLDITEGVRIVRIGEVDSCACCAPHVARTGEIGLIKCLDFASHKGGVRITMLAGARALADYRRAYEREKRIGALTSTPREQTDLAVEKLLSDMQSLRYKISEIGLSVAQTMAASVTPTEGNAVVLFPIDDNEAQRRLANLLTERVGGICTVLSGTDGAYRFVMTSRSVRLNTVIKEITATLGGKGGGKAEMVQGTFSANIDEIKCFFENYSLPKSSTS